MQTIETLRQDKIMATGAQGIQGLKFTYNLGRRSTTKFSSRMAPK